MKKLFLLFILLSSTSLIAQNMIATNSKIEFEVGSMWVRTVEGTITGMEGLIRFDPNNLAATQMNVSAKVITIKTDNEDRDKHLKNEDFFEVDKYPLIRFQASKVEKLEKGGYKVTGKLTIKDVSKEVSFPFVVDGKTLSGELEIKRLDYNVGVDQSNFSVSNEIKVKITCILI